MNQNGHVAFTALAFWWIGALSVVLLLKLRGLVPIPADEIERLHGQLDRSVSIGWCTAALDRAEERRVAVVEACATPTPRARRRR